MKNKTIKTTGNSVDKLISIKLIGIFIILLFINGCSEKNYENKKEWQNCISYNKEGNLLWNISCYGGCDTIPYSKDSWNITCSIISENIIKES